MLIGVRRRIATVAGIAVLLLAVCDTAMARDTLAPRGAKDHWLPREGWVYRHWLPFSRADLERELVLAPGQLEAFLFDDRRTLVELARAKGIDPGALRDRLVAPAAVGFTADQVAVLRERAWRVLTQGHLAQHLLYHPYHGINLNANAPSLFGLSPYKYLHLRLAGRTALELLRRQQLPVSGLVDAMHRLFDIDDAEGLRLRVTGQAATLEGRQRRDSELSCWLRVPIPGVDPTHPYAAQRTIPARRRVLRNGADLRADGRRVERYRRHLPRSCWVVPRAWKGPNVRRARTSDPDPDPALRGLRDPSTPAAAAAAAHVPRYVCDLQLGE